MRLKQTLIALALLSVVMLISMGNIAFAQTTGQSAPDYRGLWIALAVGIPAIAGGFAVATTGSSAISALTEKPEISGTVIIIVALAEGIAIYGLLVAILLIFVG
ncbi:MAG: V-type ATP synthase subunit K [Fervidicoccaceae archaeon]